MIQVDVGHQAGLQRGDTGLVYFEVATGGDLLEVEVGTGTVIATTDFTAAVEVDPGAVVEPGHLVRFEIPELRLMRPSTPSQEDDRTRGPGSEFFVAGDVSPCLNVRPLPAQFSAPLDCLPAGSRVTVTERMPGWKKVRLANGIEGWVAERFLGSSRTSTEGRMPQPPAPQRALPDLDLMRQRLQDAESALEASETAREDLEQRLAKAETTAAEPAVSTTVADLRAQLAESSAKLDEIRGYRQRLRTAMSEAEQTRLTVTRRILDTTIANLEDQLRLTADELRQAAAERDRLSREVVALRASAAETADSGQTISELAAALEDAENRRVEAERRAVEAEGLTAELEVRLERAEARIAELGGEPDRPGRDGGGERAPSVGSALRPSELPIQEATTSPSAPAGPQSADLPRDSREARSTTPGPPPPPAETIDSSARGSDLPERPSGPGTMIEKVTWQQDNGTIVFYLSLDGRVTKDDCEVVRVRSGAPRDVLKIRGIRKGLSPSVIEVGTDLVERLRTGLHWNGDQSEIHIVTDLSRPDIGIRTVRIRGNVLEVTIN